MEALTLLPRLEKEDLIETWDESRNACCGYLNKKAGRASAFSTGKWQKRWFVLKIQISGHDNYSLSYFHTPEEKHPRQSYKLDGATLTVTSGTNQNHSFQLICADSTHVMIGCDSVETMNKWISSLETAIRVAGERGQVQRERWGGAPTIQHQKSSLTVSDLEEPKDAKVIDEENNDGGFKNFEEQGTVVESFASPFSTLSSTIPALRLDVDINTIPPGSTKRNEFEEMFQNDISKSLGIDSSQVVVLNIRPSPGMEWLTVVEFDIFVDASHLGLSKFDLQDIEDDAELQIEADKMCQSKHSELLSELFGLVQNGSSVLYNGFITCSIDPSFSHGLQATMTENDDDIEIFSSDPDVMSILKKYQSVSVPAHVPNLSHFKIHLSFEGLTRSIMVPNPLILAKNSCFLWPFEVKRGIGMVGNMQELWIEPTALIPVGLPKSLSEPIDFLPSARCNGSVVIHASKLKADLTYDVICEDNRMTVLDLLTEEEKIQIKDTFDEYDTDENGTVSKIELDALVKKRTAERKEIIDKQFADVVDENCSDEGYLKAEETRRMLYQQLNESQNKLVRVFNNCDVNGDGKVTFAEFLLAEAWWLRCTINPEHATLF